MKDLKILKELRKGPLKSMKDDEYAMIEEQVTKMGIEGLNGYAKRMIEKGMREMASAMKKATSVAQGDMVSWNSSGGRATGKVIRVVREGVLSVPESSFKLNGDSENPAVLIQLYRDGKPTDKKVGHKMSTLSKSVDVEKASEKALQNKAEEHNAEVGDAAGKRTTVGILQQVYNRGVGAYKTNPSSVRPNVTSEEQWAMGRVNGFLSALRTGRFKSGKFDTDLLPEEHPLSSKGEKEEKVGKKKVDKHGDHNQSSHGNWSNDDDSEGEDESEPKNPKPKFVAYDDDSEGEFADLDADDPRWMDDMDILRPPKSKS